MSLQMDNVEHPEEIEKWFKLQTRNCKNFHKPILDKLCVELVKLLSDSLQVSNEVFISSVDVIEEYLQLKNLAPCDTGRSMTILACSILLSVKFITSHHDIKVTNIQKAIADIVHETVDLSIVKQTEIDILQTIQRVPVITMATDVTMLLKYFTSLFHITTNLQPLCSEILNIVYMSKLKVIDMLKNTYRATPQAKQVFRIIMKNRLFFPAGVILCAFKLTKYKYSLDLLLRDISPFTEIHKSHLIFLSGIFVQIISDEF